jgi:hypothetical protein
MQLARRQAITKLVYGGNMGYTWIAPGNSNERLFLALS